MDESNIRTRLREWILDQAKGKAPAAFDDRTPLLETGLLSSLDIVEFVLFIEELLGDEVDPDDIEPEAFTNIDSLWAGFFSDAGS
jgi:acyl carrier protein